MKKYLILTGVLASLVLAYGLTVSVFAQSDECPDGMTGVCCDINANNYSWPENCQECSGNACTYDASDTPSDEDSTGDICTNQDECSLGVCCDPDAYNSTTPRGEQFCDNNLCAYCPDYWCCNSAATNHVTVEQRNNSICHGKTSCRSDEPTCTFDLGSDPNSDPSSDSSDTGSDSSDTGSDDTGSDGPGTCVTLAQCEVILSDKSLLGEGAFYEEGIDFCDPEDSTKREMAYDFCVEYVDDLDLIIGSTSFLGAFSVTLTNIDYCLNISGVQNPIPFGYEQTENGQCLNQCERDGGVWIPDLEVCVQDVPECGSASGASDLNNPPAESEMCNVGVGSDMTTGDDSYTWNCNDVDFLYKVECGAGKCTNPDGCNSDLCPNLPGSQNQDYIDSHDLIVDENGDCVPRDGDMCNNLAGDQDAEYVSNNQLSLDVYNNCWVGADACGSAMNMSTWYTPPQTDLCDAGATASAVVVNNNTLKYEWSCKDAANHTVGSCSVNMLCKVGEKLCSGVCIPDATTCRDTPVKNLITNFDLQPKKVQKISQTCVASWATSLPQGATNKGCTLNNVPVPASGSRTVLPGVQTIYCYADSSYQEKKAKCEVNPDYKEI